MKRILSLILSAVMVLSMIPAMAETYQTVGVTTGDLDAQGMFYADYSSQDEALAAGNEVHLQMVEEGQVLLKNENGALPLTSDERHVTLLGIASKDFVRGGGGSGSTSGTIYKLDWEQAFEGEGFSLNPKTIELYQNLFTVMGGANEAADSGKLLEPAMSYYGKSVVNTFRSYNDAAVVFFSRFGRENMDLEMDSVPGHSNEDDHYLQLDDNELALIKLAKENFNKVIVVINSSMVMQIPELNAPVDTEYGVDAILWVGGIGDQGAKAAVEILTGKVNPSGHTVDIWPADFTKDPSFTNFSDMSQNKDENGERMNSWFTYPDGTVTVFSSVEFREGIYMGYRYYETVAADLNAAEPGSGDAWYKENVTYPFGYGLSYTTFDWKLADINAEKTISDSKEIIRISVEVENTGKVAGKDVVEIYYTAPYYQGGIEKSAAVLGGYEKTKLLQPGEKEIVTIEFVAQDMASFDSEDMNGNDFYGWEMEHGDYIISARRNSNEVVLEETFTVAEDILCETDYVSGLEVTPVFVDDYTTVRDSLLDNMITRADGLTQPKAQTAEERVLADWEAAVLDAEETYKPYNDEEGQPWYVSQVPANWTQEAETGVTLSQLAGKVYTEPTIDEDGVATASDDEISQLWDAYMNSLTWEEMVALDLGNGASEGPVQMNSGTCWQSAPITAATWNKALISEQGRQYANWLLLRGVYAINGTASNIHRSPFNGRTFEYYSEDPLISGTCAALVVEQCIQKGIINYAKHFFANVQEHNRADYGGVCTFATEQTFREIYMKSFEMMVKAGSMGLMTSFNRVGYVVNSNNWAVHEDLLRGQWGFKGATVTDAWAKDFVSVDLMVRAGDDMLLGSDSSFPKNAMTRGQWDPTARDGQGAILVPTEDGDDMFESPTHYYAVRKSAQRHLQTLVNSNRYKNFASDYELTATVYYGLWNNAEIECENTTDFSVTLALGQELPGGIDLSGFVVTYGQPVTGTEEYESRGQIRTRNTYGDFPAMGTYEVLVNMTCDGYLSVNNVKLTVNVVSPYQVNGELQQGFEDEAPVISLAKGEAADLTIDSIPLAYQKFVNLTGSNLQITNFYTKQGSRYLRDEEKTHADGTTIPYAEAEEKHEVTYTLEGNLPAGLTAEPIIGTAYGLRTNKAFDVVTGIKVTGTPTKAGEYVVTVVTNLPLCNAMAGIWLSPSTEVTVTQSFVIEVK